MPPRPGPVIIGPCTLYEGDSLEVLHQGTGPLMKEGLL